MIDRHIEGTAFHEACHCVVAALYPDLLYIAELSANESRMKLINPSFRGGLHIIPVSRKKQLSEEHMKAILKVAMAGMCGDTIKAKGSECDVLPKNRSSVN